MATLLLGPASVAMGQHDHDAPAAASAAASLALFNDADLAFLQHMIVHHEQAVGMSLLVSSRTDREELVRFASYVRRGQAAEIEAMRALLGLAADRGIVVTRHELHGDPPMAGMLSSAQMRALEPATGAEFERLWLEGMIYHHQGAIDMAHAQQQQQLESHRQPYEISVLVEEILVEQQAEIAKMQAWLVEWVSDRRAGPRAP